MVRLASFSCYDARMAPLDSEQVLTRESFQYPPDLFLLLRNAIPRLCPRKRDLITFFEGCGVGSKVLSDLERRIRMDRENISKFEIAGTVLERINKGGDPMIRVRREVIRRVTEFENFSSCWPDDQDRARSLVAQIRKRVDESDAVTKIAKEREREAEERRKLQREFYDAKIQVKEKVNDVLSRLKKLFFEKDPHRRGSALEAIMNEFFNTIGLSIRENFVISGPRGVGIVDQIDGAIEMDGHVYLVEIKWWNKKLGPREINDLLGSIYAQDVRGLFISASGYTPAAEDAARKALRDKIVILCTVEEIILVLESEKDFIEFLREKVRIAQLSENPNGRVIR